MGTTMQETSQANGQGKLRYIELFAGIGGFGLALNRLGHVCVWANEWDKYAATIYNRQFSDKGREQESIGKGAVGEHIQRQGDIPNGNVWGRKSKQEKGYRIFNGVCCDTRDLTTVPTSEIPDHDLLVGGFPCQAFSIAGKRRGFDDTRGTLFFEIARILKDKQPKLFILENVKGLLSHDNGNTFKTIISTFDELGYDLEWQVLNSKNFGVPQNRERVFIVGHIRGTSRPEVFPIGQDDNPLTTKGGEQASSAIISRTLTATDAKMHLDGNYIKTAIPVLTPDRFEKRQNGRRFKENGDPSFTLTGQDRHGVSDGVRIRRLTPTECERLQGFPDGWTEGISDTQRYKCLGNAVTVNVVYEIARRINV